MANPSKLLLPFSLLILLVILGHIVILAGACMKILHWEGASLLLNIGILLQLCTWVVVIADIVGNDFRNRLGWIAAVIVFGNVGSFVYLLNRKGLLGM